MADTGEGASIPIKRDTTVNPTWTANAPTPPISEPVTNPVQQPVTTPVIVPVSGSAVEAAPVAAPASTSAVLSVAPLTPEVPAEPVAIQTPSAVIPESTSSAQPVAPVVPPPVIPTTMPASDSVIDPALAIEPTPADHPGFSWKPILIGLLVILLLGGIVFGLWFFGVGFGAPADPKVAFLKMSQALAKTESYHIKGNASISIREDNQSGIVPSQASLPLVLESWLPKAMAASDSSVTTIPTYGSSSNSYGLGIEFNADRAGSELAQSTLKFDLSGLGNNLPPTFPNTIEMNIREVGKDIYMRLPILSLFFGSESNKWLVFTRDDITSLTGKNGDTSINYTDLSTAISSSKRVGFERIGPVQTAHYQAQLSSSDLARILKLDASDTTLLSEAVTVPITFDWWIGVNNHLPYQVKVSTEVSADATLINLSISLVYSNYGVAPQISAPDPADVSSEGINSLFVGSDILGGVEVTARDTQRKSDLASLKSALSMYRNDHGSYPTTNGNIDRTNTSESVLRVLVKQGYLSVLPADPTEDFWYGYKSVDGSTYELWSILEDESDTTGILRDGLYLYIVNP